MNAAKIRLSPKEAELINNSGWILTKNEIIKKIKVLLEAMQEEQQKIIASGSPPLPSAILIAPPKISKGENYKGLPYLVLDYPRCFDREHIFAVRTMFWWGNFFSCTLQLSGKYKKQYEERLSGAYSLLKKERISCCINNDPWEHHFKNNNYRPVNKLREAAFKKMITEKPFIKLAAKISLRKCPEAPEFLLSRFNLFLKMVTG